MIKIKDQLKSTAVRLTNYLLHPQDKRARRYSLLSFLLPAVMLLIAYFAMGLYPFGNKSVLSYDLNAQYAHFFAGLKNILASGNSLLYTWFRTLGGEFMGIIAYYLVSPFNFLIFLLPLSMIETAILLTVLCKTGLIGFTAHLYFTRGMKLTTDRSLIFSTAYALCSYCVVYGSNLMWLDALLILPLLLWGIEKLIRNEGHGLYVFTLAYAMITNYYMGYMLCIVTAAYFFVYLFGEHSDGLEHGKSPKNALISTFARMGIYTVIALGVSAIIVLPAYHSLSFGKTEFTVPDFTPTQTADFLAILKKTLIGSYDPVDNGTPYIYSGLLPLLFAPIYFLSRKIGNREKLANGILLCFIFSGLFISTVDLFWHGFQFPNGLNYRYAFVFSFLLCKLAAKAYGKEEGISKKSVYAVVAYIALAIFCIQAQGYGFGDDLTCIWLSLGALALYAALYCFMHYAKKERFLTLTLTVCICLELTVASALSLTAYGADVNYSKHNSLEGYIEKYKPSADAIYKENTGFYRVEHVGKTKTNDTLSLGLRGISGSTSTLNASVITLMDLIGYGGNSNFANYFDASPVADSIFGIRYFISAEKIDNGVYILNEKLTAESEDGVYVYENPLALSVLFSASAAVIPQDLSEYRSVFETNNALISALTGAELSPYTAVKLKGASYGSVYPNTVNGHTYFVPSSPLGAGEYHSISFTVPTEKGKPLFVCLTSDNACKAKVYVNDELAFNLNTAEGESIRCLGTFGGETVTVRLEWTDTDLSLKSGISYFYQLDPAVLEEAYEMLANNQVNVTEHSNTKLSGSFNFSSALPVLYTTVPYDGDWTLTVDGKPVETLRASGALLSADLSSLSLTEGEHTVELTYRSASFTAGAVISAVAVLSLIAIHAVNRGILTKLPPFNKKRTGEK